MGFYDDYPQEEFEPLKEFKKAKKKKKRKKLLKKAKKFFKKFRSKACDIILSTMSQMVLRFFDKKLERAFA